MNKWTGWGVVGLAGLLGFTANAQERIPPELQGWQGWVLEGEASRRCALKAGAEGNATSDYQCQAASDLLLSPSQGGIAFSVRLKTDAPALIPLPGEARAWPSNVRVNGQGATLRYQDNQWFVSVPQGESTVQGQWAQSFDRIAVPALFARTVWQPEGRLLRRESNQVWLKSQAAPASEEDASSPPVVQVWRQLTDGQVIRLTTQVLVRLSSAPQRLTVGQALPAGFVPLSWNSTVPAVVTANGQLQIQAGRGSHTITIEAQCSDACVPTDQGTVPPAALALKPASGLWPAQETWSVVGNPAFRQLGVDGEGVDPAAAHVPEAWRSAPAYRVSANQGLALKQSSRGRQPGEGETLQLERETWLGEDGWINWDIISGTLPVGGRLAMEKPYVLGRVEHAGTPLPLSADGAGNVGLEWGTPSVQAWAQSTQPLGRVPATGWNATIERMEVTMHLPPGTALIAAPGTTAGSGAWTDRFTLLSFFGIALLALLARQALGNVAAVVAGLVAAGWVGNGGALLLLWLLALAISFHLLAQAIPPGRLQTSTQVIRAAAWGVFVLAWIPFAGDQSRMAMHPQLTAGNHASSASSSDTEASAALDSAVYESPGEAGPPPPPMPAPMESMAARSKAAIAAPDLSNAVNGNDPLAGIGLANVGQPLPTWHTHYQGHQYRLTYPGPLRPMSNQNSYTGPGASGTHRVWVAPVWSIQVLRVLGTLALAWLALRLLSQFSTRWVARLPKAPSLWARRLGFALALVPLVGMAQEPAQTAPVSITVSTLPDAKTLAELKQRLTQPPACAPACATLVAADLEASDNQITVSYRVSVEHASAWNLPTVSGATLTTVLVDGSPAFFATDQSVVLSPGQARVVARYQPLGESLGIDFPQPPLETTERVNGWTVSGAVANGTWALERTAVAQANPTDDLAPAAAIAGFFHITRRVVLGANATLTTTIERLPGNTGALVLHLPQVTGESVESDRVAADGKTWVVTLPAGQTTMSWESRLTLPENGEVVLTPLPAKEGIETWNLIKGPAWTVVLSGVPESMPQETSEGLIRQILPLAGEALHIKAARLPAAPGEKQRVDSVALEMQAGPHDATTTLAFVATTTQAGERTLTFPANSEVTRVLVNQQQLSLPLQNNRLVIPLQRGQQNVSVEFRTPASLFRLTTPQVDLGGPASNVSYHLGHTENRWVLLTWGPGWGTAVLYWSQLAVLLLVAYGLSRLPRRLFSLPAAVLLVLGFSTLPGTVFWLAALIGWQLWVSWRAGLAEGHLPAHFNLQQLALAGFTAVTVLALTGAIAYGLLGAQPDMMVRAPFGLRPMEWLVASLPSGPMEGPTVVSLPMWVYQCLLFAWALWFAAWLIQAVKRALMAWLHLGYWRKPAPTIPPIPPKADGLKDGVADDSLPPTPKTP